MTEKPQSDEMVVENDPVEETSGISKKIIAIAVVAVGAGVAWYVNNRRKKGVDLEIVEDPEETSEADVA